MSASAVIDVFPRRAIDLKASRGRTIWLLGGLVLLVLFLWYGYSTVQRFGLRSDLRERGVGAEVLSSEGSCYSRRQINGDEPHGCNLTISYRARPEHGGGERQAKLYLPGSAPLVFAPAVIYDPQDPDRAMTERDVQREERIVDIALPAIGLLGCSAGAFLVWFAMGRRVLTAAAKEPRPVIVEIERMEPEAGLLKVWFKKPDGQSVQQNFQKTGPLLVRADAGAQGDRHYALALLTDKERPILMDQDLSQLDLTANELMAIQQAAMA
jgi:hypothetical protein